MNDARDYTMAKILWHGTGFPVAVHIGLEVDEVFRTRHDGIAKAMGVWRSRWRKYLFFKTRSSFCRTYNAVDPSTGWCALILDEDFWFDSEEEAEDPEEGIIDDSDPLEFEKERAQETHRQRRKAGEGDEEEIPTHDLEAGVIGADQVLAREMPQATPTKRQRTGSPEPPGGTLAREQRRQLTTAATATRDDTPRGEASESRERQTLRLSLSQTVVRMDDLDPAKIPAWENFILQQSSTSSFSRRLYMNDETSRMLSIIFEALDSEDCDHETWPHDVFFKRLRTALPPHDAVAFVTPTEAFENVRWNFNGNNHDTVVPLLYQIKRLRERLPRATSSAEEAQVEADQIKVLLLSMKKKNTLFFVHRVIDMLMSAIPKTWPVLEKQLFAKAVLCNAEAALITNYLAWHKAQNKEVRLESTAINPQSKQKQSLVKSTPSKPQASAGGGATKKKDNNIDKWCTGCGRQFHLVQNCVRRNDPGWNPDPIPYVESAYAKQHGVTRTPNVDKQPTTTAQKDPKKSFKKSKYLGMLKSKLTPSNDIVVWLQSPNGEKRAIPRVLLDSGASHANYGSEELETLLVRCGYQSSKVNDIVYDPWGNANIIKVKFKDVFITLHMDTQTITLPIDIDICTIVTHELIIGRPTLLRMSTLLTQTPSDIAMKTATWYRHQSGPSPDVRDETPQSLPSMTPPLVAAMLKKGAFSEPDNDSDEDDGLDAATWYEQYTQDDKTPDSAVSAAEPWTVVKIQGTANLQQILKKLVEEYKDIFSPVLGTEPAVLDGMDLRVDQVKWKTNGNRAPLRPQTLPKQDEIYKQVTAMEAAGIIKKSQAAYYSQVLLTPKPNGKWRFCIDYRRLNEVTESLGWPIPNIRSTLQRIGSRHARWFAVMDLTSGYHQVKLAKRAQQYSAFITHCGVYEFLRIPFGMKGSPSFFQQVMATVVLTGLIYIICEVYLDDILVYGTDEVEFVARLAQVFARFRKHNLKVNPDKTRLGLEEVEYVGHIINQRGITFSTERKEATFKIPLPQTMRQLKSFLGLANYFRDHVRDYAGITRELQVLTQQYHPHRMIKWTPTTTEAFENIKRAILKAPMLHFIEEEAPLVLCTDASDYGVGGYLFQLQTQPDGVVTEAPIAFVSKTLKARQIETWTVEEKECYAIKFSLEKLQHYLRDSPFTLRTDHRNLLFLKKTTAGRVLRWKLAIQEYNFTLEYIPGPSNVIADSLSRQEQPVKKILHALGVGRLSDGVRDRIKAVHNSSVGHHGVERTLAYLQKQGHHWKYMRDHVKTFVKQCPLCQKMNRLKIPIRTVRFTLARYNVMERVNMDTIGPLPPDEQGNEYILVIIDCFSRWVQMYPTRTTEAREAARHLLTWISNYSAPCEILSDRGSQFVNEVIDDTLTLVGTTRLLSLAYSHEENGLVERANQTVMRHLRTICADRKINDRWSESLPLVQRIMNATPHTSTGVAPFRLLYANSIDLDQGFIFRRQLETREQEEPLSDYMARMIDLQTATIEAAQKAQEKLDESNLRKRRHADIEQDRQLTKESWSTAAEKPSTCTEFEEGSFVLAEYPNTGLGKKPPHKLAPTLQGPLEVIGHDGATYHLRDLATMKLIDKHVTQLRPFYYDPDIVDPGQVAQIDKQMWTVERIVAHSGRRDKRKSLLFKVRWAGCTEAEDTWQTLADLRHNILLHKYLRDHNMTTLIPEIHKQVTETVPLPLTTIQQPPKQRAKTATRRT